MAEAETDWDSVTYLRKKTPRAAELKSKQVTYFLSLFHDMVGRIQIKYKNETYR